jgi:hypothetical protein
MNEFIYDDTAPYEINFTRWWVANCIEREMYKEPLLEIEDAELVFHKQYGYKKLQEKIYIN